MRTPLSTVALRTLALALLLAVPLSAETQRRNLADAPPKSGRLKVSPDRVWPEKIAQAHVCLWKDDALAAFSFTIDDNCAPDHDWWLEMGEKYGFRFTWFVITGRVGGGGYWGTWEGWQKLRDAGHDVQSHTVTHLHPEDPKFHGIVGEYADSQKDITTHLKNTRPLTLAYPGGKNSKLNSRQEAAKLYIAARGTRGTLNAAGSIDYLAVNATGAIHLGDRKGDWADLRNLFEEKNARYHQLFGRGWGVALSHGATPAAREHFTKIMEYLKARGDDAWVGLFREVAQYGQERDTATLTVTANTPEAIRLKLTDEMADDLFDMPLTIKVRVPDSWQSIRATQNDKPLPAKLITHDAKRYALVPIVPDRGEVTLQPGAAAATDE